ncbi:hypothetical protein L1887_20563 [Cichorium endivia]|nr:hypothetical protein L1887_20563 [Cichorium endivia]
MSDGICHQTGNNLSTTREFRSSLPRSSPIQADITPPHKSSQALSCHILVQEMSVRTSLVILFFWAALTIVTPILVRMSFASNNNGELEEGEVMSFLPRRTLISTASPPAPAPAPCVGGVQFAVMQRYSRKALVKQR